MKDIKGFEGKYAITKDGKVFQNIAEANEFLGKDRKSGNITKCLTGKNKKAWGYTWVYFEEDK